MGMLTDFLYQRAMLNNPGFAARQNQQANQEHLRGLLGTAPVPQQSYQTEIQTEGPMMPGQERADMPVRQITQEAQPGTGLLGGQLKPVEAAVGFMGSPMADTRAIGSDIMRGMYSKPQQGDFSFQQYQAMSPSERKTYDRYKGRGFNQQAQMPSTVREWQYFSSLPPDKQQQFMQMKRQTQWLNAGDRHVNPPIMGVSQENIPINPKVTETADYIEEKEKTIIKAKDDAARLLTADSDLDSGKKIIKLIDSAMVHPGREMATGTSSLVPLVPGFEPYNYGVRLEQLKGTAFLEAFSSLKGGGTISEIEGLKAEQAQQRLNAAQSEKAHLEALKEMKGMMQQRVEKIQSFKAEQTGQVPENSEFDDLWNN